MTNTHEPKWDLTKAREFYSIPVWGEEYFDLNEKGHVVAKLDCDQEIDLYEISQKLVKYELSLPVLIRFPQILQARIKELCAAFSEIITKRKSNIRHTPIYPIKVNQQRTVVEHVLASGQASIGLEVGSKTELLAALGLLHTKQGLLVCNGYKDRAYVRIALHAQRMGIQVFIVIENLSEFALVEKECAQLKMKPNLGVRVRLNSIAAGNWQNTGGRYAKFGLDTHDLLQLLQQMNAHQCEDYLQLLHFHMGSQISNLEDIAQGVREAMQIYSELCANGFNLNYIDVGGGLAIDYAARKDTSYFSKSYTIKEYARTVIDTIEAVCRSDALAMPHVFTENGRAMTAHHAVLITNVVEVEQKANQQLKDPLDKFMVPTLATQAHDILNKLQQSKSVSIEELEQFEHLANRQFLQGKISLQQRAHVEEFLRHCFATQTLDNDLENLANKYYCNFSLFQSLPDVWGLQQIFPILPLARLEQQPTKEARLHDLTCDSDGQISTYLCRGALTNSLSLHSVNENEQYMLGFFLVGAYQEVLGDMHNLFGDTHTVNVERRQNGDTVLTEVEVGDCVAELLDSVHLDSNEVMKQCVTRLRDHKVSNKTEKVILEEIQDALFGYTYLDSIDRAAHRIKGHKHA